MANNIRVGRIVGNPLCGLNERVCIEAKSIYDGCIDRIINQRFENLPLSNYSSNAYDLPLNFVRIYSLGNAEVSNLAVTPLGNGRATVRYNAVLPMLVEMTDASGVFITATTQLSRQRETTLSLPADGSSYSVEVVASARGRIGDVSADGSLVSFTGCVAVITRMVTIVDIVIPSYGKCVYPECNRESDSCLGLFNVAPFN